MHDLNPSSTKPCLSLVEENLKKLHGVNLRSASVSEMRRLLPAETASCSSKNIGCKGGGTPSARQEGGDAASANNADDSMRLQVTSQTSTWDPRRHPEICPLVPGHPMFG